MSIEASISAAERSMDHGNTRSVVIFHEPGSLAEHLVTAHGIDSVEAPAYTFPDHTVMHAVASKPGKLDDILPVSHSVRQLQTPLKRGL